MSLGITPDTLTALGLAPEDADEMVRKLDNLDPGVPAGELWGRVSRELLSPDVPFPVHLHLYKSIFKDWDQSQGPFPAWTPSERDIAESNIAALAEKAGLASVHDLHRWSVEHRSRILGAGDRYSGHQVQRAAVRGGRSSPRGRMAAVVARRPAQHRGELPPGTRRHPGDPTPGRGGQDRGHDLRRAGPAFQPLCQSPGGLRPSS